MVSLSRWHGFQEGKTATVEKLPPSSHRRGFYACSGNLGIQKEIEAILDIRGDVTSSGSISKGHLLFVNPVQLTLTLGKYGLQDYNVITAYPRRSCRI